MNKKIKIRRNRLITSSAIIIFVLILSLFYINYSNTAALDDNDEENTYQFESILKTDYKKEFSTPGNMVEYNGTILFGPYHIDDPDEGFYILEGNVYDSKLREVTNDKVIFLHNFYLYTRSNPLFYSPYDDIEQINFTKFENFSEEQYLSVSCNQTLENYPKEYYKELTKNILATDEFLENPSTYNAYALIEQNEITFNAYSLGLNNIIDGFVNPTIENSSCSDNVEYEFTTNYGFFIPYTDKKIYVDNILSILDQFNQNTKNLNEEIQYRKKVLSGEKDFIYPKLILSKTHEEKLNDYYSREMAIDLLELRSINDVAMREGLDSQQEITNETYESRLNVADINISKIQFPDVKEEELYLFELNLICFPFDKGLVYGIDKDIYPNIFLATYFDKSLDNLLSICACPYVAQTSLHWELIYDMFQRIGNQPISDYFSEPQDQELAETVNHMNAAEEDFLNYPSQDNLQFLSQTYRKVYFEHLEKGVYNENLEEIWKRHILIDSKIYLYKKTFDRYYKNLPERHKYFWAPKYKERGLTEDMYYVEFFTESFFFLNFMQWSGSVWQSEPIHDLYVVSQGEDIQERPLYHWEQFIKESDNLKYIEDLKAIHTIVNENKRIA